MISFVNWSSFFDDLRNWERRLPQFDAVCGVPRSGLFPASYIAMQRNIRLVELDELLEDPTTALAKAPIRSTNPLAGKTVGNRLLIVDDSSTARSVTFRNIQSKLKDQKSLDISYGAVYRESDRSAADYWHVDLPMPRIFEWNWLRHCYLRNVLFDMDGVLCEDWLHRLECDNDPEFVEHVSNAKPLFIPQVPILGIVTSRLERYRPQTEAWLAKHGVKYSHLEMHPAKTPDERRARADHAKRKAQAYLAATDAMLFVESSSHQAFSIAKLSSRPVLLANAVEPFRLIKP
jgi:uncharacterized HAD superfamily protein